MTRFTIPTQPVASFFFACIFALTLLLAGCSAGAISGPDLSAPDASMVETAPSAQNPNALHNEGDGTKETPTDNAGGGGGSSGGGGSNGPSNGGDHNEG